MSMAKRTTRAKPLPKAISAAELKVKRLALMGSVAATGASIVVTKRGRSMVRPSPVRARRGSGLGFMKGRIRILGDIVSPIDAAWGASA
jgi:antitoxin (DNA-binding transcriptional repressor) of toxin-antitoxin stability system